MIRHMDISNVLTVEGEYATYTVSASDLEFHFPEVYSSLEGLVPVVEEHAFFCLACTYLEMYDSSVESIDEAKVGRCWEN
jgi:hypothetical protein